MGFQNLVLDGIKPTASALMLLASTCATIGLIILVLRRGLLQDSSSGGFWRSLVRYVMIVASIFVIPQLAIWAADVFSSGNMDLGFAKTFINGTF